MPLPEPMLTYQQWGSVVVTLDQIQREYSKYQWINCKMSYHCHITSISLIEHLVNLLRILNYQNLWDNPTISLSNPVCIWLISLAAAATAVRRKSDSQDLKYLCKIRNENLMNGTLVTLAQSVWWRHQMETFSALLAICAGNSPVSGEFPAQRPVTRSFEVFFDLRLNKRLSKQWWGWWFETLSHPLWRHRNGLNP